MIRVFSVLVLCSSLFGLGFAAAWRIQEDNVTKLELEHAQQRIESDRATRHIAEKATQAVLAAQNSANKRAVTISNNASVAGSAGDGLRLTAGDSVHRVSEDSSTCDSVISAYSTVVTASSEFIQRVAADADQCHSDIQLMTEAWPK